MKAKEVEVHHNNSTFKKRKITQGSSDIKEKKIKVSCSLIANQFYLSYTNNK